MPTTNATPRFTPRWTPSSSPTFTSWRSGFHEQGSPFILVRPGQRTTPSLPNARLMTTRHSYPTTTPVHLSFGRHRDSEGAQLGWVCGVLRFVCRVGLGLDGGRFGWWLVRVCAKCFFLSPCTSLCARKPMDASRSCEQTPQERARSWLRCAVWMLTDFCSFCSLSGSRSARWARHWTLHYLIWSSSTTLLSRSLLLAPQASPSPTLPEARFSALVRRLFGCVGSGGEYRIFLLRKHH